MKYTVVWQPSAETALAHLWNTAEDRGAVARAADVIDEVLKLDPLVQGELYSSSRRIMFVAPLVVHFEVLESDRLVRVLKILRIRSEP